MLFNSFTFLIFFAVVLGLHCLRLPWNVKKLNLLVASYLFYAAWHPPFVILLGLATAINWSCARGIFRANSPTRRRCLLVLSIATNLGMLAFFKYANFLLDSFTTAVSLVGIEYGPPAWNIVLPVGISFYTFQTLSYTIDVYRGTMAPWESRLDFALYAAFFPQLVAGPIVRGEDFLPQCTAPHVATGSQLGWGMSLLVLGLFEKIVIADGLLAPVATLVFDPTAPTPGCASAWCGTLAFAGQIFCDFAGYSTCAIGVALCLGFHLPDNFHFPYAAIGFSDFWRRWHISLSSWLRDYLYISLGGNRLGSGAPTLNLALTMLLGGLWHGASWTFVAWGGLHGVYLIVERALTRTRIAGFACWRTRIGRAGLAFVTFLAVCVTWVLFRASSFGQAWAIFTSMFGFGPAASADLSKFSMIQAAVPTCCLVMVHWLLRDTTLERVLSYVPLWLLSLLLGIMIVVIIMMPGEDRAFIYFQF